MAGGVVAPEGEEEEAEGEGGRRRIKMEGPEMGMDGWNQEKSRRDCPSPR